jgi:hypothetical protein
MIKQDEDEVEENEHDEKKRRRAKHEPRRRVRSAVLFYLPFILKTARLKGTRIPKKMTENFVQSHLGTTIHLSS